METGLSLAASGLAWVLALVLCRASLHKLTDFYRTVGAALDYGAAPEAWVPRLVRLLGIVEAGCVLALIVPASRPFAGMVAAILFAVYALLMARVLRQGRVQIDCGCGGAPQPISGLSLLRNGVLTGAGVAVALLPVAATGPLGAILGLLCGLTLFASYALLEKFASHLPQIRQVRHDLSRGSMQWNT
ncbi:MauE/DoxX family redox-associated membrane protein [Paracoccus sp. PAR01]|uniref:MauE/DoxX family redox-associated membrane protein n=1 Tax=Paracoccus sp. PAR01 TaxID=2769282 RepID=UPI001782ED4E|nr:MauE/DoxX family redox-associated membrane protein [Paracoccus sp. PAR01]MBD9527339.1 methylamine utilization protein MauE [Paracoccus sp. PAR01]